MHLEDAEQAYERAIRIADKSFFDETQSSLRNWDILRRYVMKRSLTFDAAQTALKRPRMFVYYRAQDICEFEIEIMHKLSAPSS